MFLFFIKPLTHIVNTLSIMRCSYILIIFNSFYLLNFLLYKFYFKELNTNFILNITLREIVYCPLLYDLLTSIVQFANHLELSHPLLDVLLFYKESVIHLYLFHLELILFAILSKSSEYLLHFLGP